MAIIKLKELSEKFVEFYKWWSANSNRIKESSKRDFIRGNGEGIPLEDLLSSKLSSLKMPNDMSLSLQDLEPEIQQHVKVYLDLTQEVISFNNLDYCKVLTYLIYFSCLEPAYRMVGEEQEIKKKLLKYHLNLQTKLQI